MSLKTVAEYWQNRRRKWRQIVNRSRPEHHQQQQQQPESLGCRRLTGKFEDRATSVHTDAKRASDCALKCPEMSIVWRQFNATSDKAVVTPPTRRDSAKLVCWVASVAVITLAAQLNSTGRNKSAGILNSSVICPIELRLIVGVITSPDATQLQLCAVFTQFSIQPLLNSLLTNKRLLNGNYSDVISLFL